MFTESIKAEVLRGKSICCFNETLVTSQDEFRFHVCCMYFLCETHGILAQSCRPPFPLSGISTQKEKQNLISFYIRFTVSCRTALTSGEIVHTFQKRTIQLLVTFEIGEVKSRSQISSFLCQSIIYLNSISRTLFLTTLSIYTHTNCCNFIPLSQSSNCQPDPPSSHLFSNNIFLCHHLPEWPSPQLFGRPLNQTPEVQIKPVGSRRRDWLMHRTRIDCSLAICPIVSPDTKFNILHASG